MHVCMLYASLTYFGVPKSLTAYLIDLVAAAQANPPALAESAQGKFGITMICDDNLVEVYIRATLHLTSPLLTDDTITVPSPDMNIASFLKYVVKVPDMKVSIKSAIK